MKKLLQTNDSRKNLPGFIFLCKNYGDSFQKGDKSNIQRTKNRNTQQRELCRRKKQKKINYLCIPYIVLLQQMCPLSQAKRQEFICFSCKQRNFFLAVTVFSWNSIFWKAFSLVRVNLLLFVLCGAKSVLKEKFQKFICFFFHCGIHGGPSGRLHVTVSPSGRRVCHDFLFSLLIPTPSGTVSLRPMGCEGLLSLSFPSGSENLGLVEGLGVVVATEWLFGRMHLEVMLPPRSSTTLKMNRLIIVSADASANGDPKCKTSRVLRLAAETQNSEDSDSDEVSPLDPLW